MFEKKAKSILTFFTTFLASVALYAGQEIPQTELVEKLDLEPHEDELVTIERMIVLTGRQHQAQIQLKFLIEDLRRNKEIFMKGEPSKLHARYMIRSAKQALSLIREYHLEHLFSSDFLEELALLGQIGKRP